MSEYTKGKWKAMQENLGLGHKGNIVVLVEDKGGTRIGICDILDQNISPTEQTANAELIAAAPELLKACKEILSCAIVFTGTDLFLDSAITKTLTGEIAKLAKAAIAAAVK